MTAPTLIALIDTAGRGEEDGIGIASSSPRKTGSPHRASLPAQSWSGAGAVSHAVDARDGIDHVAFEVGVDGLVGRRNRQRRNLGAAVRIWPENGSAECGEDFQPPIAAAITAAQEVAAAVRSSARAPPEKPGSTSHHYFNSALRSLTARRCPAYGFRPGTKEAVVCRSLA